MSVAVRDEGRSASLKKRRFYARYMGWLERVGYAVVLLVIGAFVYAFTARVDDVIAADGVELAPASAPIEARGAGIVVARLAEEGGEVASGAALFEVVAASDDAAYRRWAAAEEIGEPGLRARFPKPPTEIVRAPKAGTFRPTLATGAEFAGGETLGSVVDYGEVRAEASLAGDTASRAAAGGEARITNLAFPNPERITLRGGVSSRTLLDPKLRGEIERGLVGRGVRLKNETLTVAKVTEVEVGARAKLTPDPSKEGDPLDLGPGTALRARVLSGVPIASAQIATLPPDLAARVRAAVAALGGRSVVAANGDSLRIEGADASDVLVKVRAEGLATGSGPALSGALLKLTFDADLRVVSPPPALVRALREADRSGKPVTCRVELVTGTRPLAFLLLKRS